MKRKPTLIVPFLASLIVATTALADSKPSNNACELHRHALNNAGGSDYSLLKKTKKNCGSGSFGSCYDRYWSCIDKAWDLPNARDRNLKIADCAVRLTACIADRVV